MSKRRHAAADGTVSVHDIVERQVVWRRRYEEAKADADKLRAALESIARVGKHGFEPIEIRPVASRNANEATAVLVCSDWHAFERVRPEEVNNLNEYNADIAGRSIASLFQTALRLVEIERAAINVPHFVLCLLGDLMTSQLHPDQVETNEGTAQQEMLFLLEHLTGGIDLLLRHGGFEKIIIPCCDGNHGRATDKLRAANRVHHSNEWLLYCLLAQHYAKEPRVKFSIAEGMLHYIDIYGRRVRLTHGDGIVYKGGVGGLTIPARKAILEWDRGIKADWTIFGHYHTSILDKAFLANGSLLGYSPYSVTIKAAYEPAAQSFVLIGQRRWLLSYRPIYVR